MDLENGIRPKMYFECASFSFAAPCKPHNLFGVYNTKCDLRIRKAEYLILCVCTDEL